MQFDYSILIPTWNNLAILQNCIRSIRLHSKAHFEILVFVNEGNDGTAEWLKKENIRFIESAENVGICIAMNKLKELVDSPLICYLNDDMFVLPSWDVNMLTEILNFSHNKYFLSSTMIEPNADGNPCSINGDFGRDLSNFREQELLARFSHFPKGDWSGSSWPPLWISVDLWDTIGGFSEEFSPGMYSDPDMAKKAWDHGVRDFKGVAASRVYHFGSKSTKRPGMNEGRKMFIKKWGITSRYFYKYYLRMGQIYNGRLGEVEHPFLGKLINRVKTLIN